jgi:hypothetical protein
MDGETEKNFWIRYLNESDPSKKKEQLRFIVRNIDSLRNVKEDSSRQHAMLSLVQSYFDDLIDSVSEYCTAKENTPVMPERY